MQDTEQPNPEDGEENPEADLKKGEKQMNEQENKQDQA
jgi:hypothetical protein